MKAIACAVLGSLALESTFAIFGGDVVPKGERSYTAFLSIEKNSPLLCTAVLIEASTVLTTASCLTQSPKYVTIGSQFSKRPSDAEVLKIKETRIHPKYDRPTGAFSISILKLEGKSKYTPASLPVSSDSSTTIKVKDPAISLGWGSTDPNNYFATSERLNSLKVTVVESGPCRNATGFSFIDRQFLCAGGGEGTGFALYDHGGPLILDKYGKSTVVGVLSYQFRSPTPSVYARTSAVRDWILSQL